MRCDFCRSGEWDKDDLVHITGLTNLFFVPKEINPGYEMPDIKDEITDTKEKVIEFCDKYCLPGFLPSWCDEINLTESDLALLHRVSVSDL